MEYFPKLHAHQFQFGFPHIFIIALICMVNVFSARYKNEIKKSNKLSAAKWKMHAPSNRQMSHFHANIALRIPNYCLSEVDSLCRILTHSCSTLCQKVLNDTTKWEETTFQFELYFSFLHSRASTQEIYWREIREAATAAKTMRRWTLSPTMLDK